MAVVATLTADEDPKASTRCNDDAPLGFGADSGVANVSDGAAVSTIRFGSPDALANRDASVFSLLRSFLRRPSRSPPRTMQSASAHRSTSSSASFSSLAALLLWHAPPSCLRFFFDKDDEDDDEEEEADATLFLSLRSFFSWRFRSVSRSIASRSYHPPRL